MMGWLRAWSAAALLLALALLAWPAPALAHGGDTTSAQTYVQSLGRHEVELTIQPTRRVPGPLLVELRFHGAAPEQVLLRAAPQAAWPDDTNMARVRPIVGDAGPYVVQLHVDRAGPWELQLASLHGDTTLVPFTVRAPALDPDELGRSAAFAGAAGLVLAGGALGTLARRRPVAGWLIWPIGLGALVCLTVGLTLAVQQSFTPPPQPAAARSHVNLALRTTPWTPQAGAPLSLELSLSDGASGQPVDDLVTHHEALLHLIVISADGGFFAHLHPARVAPGRYQVRLTPDRPGRYSVYAEIERRDSGTQLLARDFTVSGRAVSPPATTQGLGTHQLDELTVAVTSSQPELRVGQPTTLNLQVSQDGQPVSAIEPWLGMAGHLIIRSADETIISHVHAAGTMGEDVYGPEIRFAYTFPQSGAYRLWAQFHYGGAVRTLPLTLHVNP
jgi:hypothetical protein